MTEYNFTIKGSDGATIPLNALFTTRDDGSSNTAEEFDYWKNKDSNGVMTNYITGKNNKTTYLSGAAKPVPLAGPDSTGTSLGYLEDKINKYNGGFGLDSCTFTDYQGPVGSKGGRTANYLGAYFEDFFVNVANTSTTTNPTIPTWCNYIIIAMVGGGGGGGSNWISDNEFSIGGGGGGGGYVIAKSYNLTDNNITKLEVTVGAYGQILNTGKTQTGTSQSGFNSTVKLLDQESITRATLTATGGVGGTVGTSNSDCAGGKGGGSESSPVSAFEIIGSKAGFTGKNGQRYDDNDNDWGSRAGRWGAESLVGCFYSDSGDNAFAFNDVDAGNNNNPDCTQLDSYNPSSYGRGGRGSGAGDDDNDGESYTPLGTPGGNGWVRIYFMRN